MAATITGIVFNDLNHNGQYTTGEPGISGVYVVLYSSAAGCVTAQTDANGNYTFSVTAAGSYTVYEPVTSPGTCPPTNFTQPAGFTMSNGPRKLAVAVTAAQVSNGAVIDNQNFSHDTVNNPLPCTTQMIQFVGRPTNWYTINVVTGQPTLQGPLSPADNVNAIGYNPLDSYIYGYDQSNNALVRVTGNGMLIQLPRPTGLPADNFNVGTFDSNGFLYLMVNDTNRFYTVDLRPNSPTFLKLVNPAAGYTEQTSNYGTALSATTNISDWVYDPADGNLYGVQRNGVLTRIVPTTGQVTSLTTTAPNPNASFGALAIDSTGVIYAIANNDGTIYKYTFSGNTARGVAFSQTSFDSFNDGTMCPAAAIQVDYGDAPDPTSNTGPGDYNTLLANNGPRHELVNALTLGTQVTAESDAYQNPTATGDDIPKGIQDDGLSVPLNPLPLSAPAYTLSVAVTNETGLTANLYGWIDFNQNGLFETDEAAPVASVPSAPGVQTIPLTFTKPTGDLLTAGNTFVRLRLTTDTLAETPGAQDSRSVGPASDGEVEDYILAIASVADLAVVKTADRDSLTTGEVITYTIDVTNNGPDAAMDTTLTDTVPPTISNPEYSLDGGASWQPWPGSLSLGTLEAGESVTVLLRGTYTGTDTNPVINLAQVTTSSSDPDLSNNTDTVVTPTTTAEADLSITKTAEPSPATAGDLLVYTLYIVNNGPNTAQDVIVADTPPSELLNPEFSIDGGATYQPWNSPYSLGDLPAGASVTILLRGIVDPSATGSILNTAEVSSSTADPDLSNNTDTVETPISEQADISVVKLGSPNPAQPGEYLTYTIVVSNAGPSTAADVILTDTVPPSLEQVEYSTDLGASWQPWPGSYVLGNLAPGSTQTILIRGIVSSSAEGILSNTATVDSSTPDPDPGNNSSTDETPVDVRADLAVFKTSEPNPVPLGKELTYTIEVFNYGPSDAQSVKLIDAVPPELANVEYSLDGGATYQPWTGSADLGTLASGASQIVLIRGLVTSAAAGSLVNTAVVDSPTPDPDPNNNQDTEITNVETSADLAITKIGDPSPVLPGQLLTYTITVENRGPDPALDVLVTDAIPASLIGVEYSTNGGATWQPWTGALALGALANGETRSILIRGTVTASSGTIVNTATVSSNTPDPDPNNNQDTVITPVIESADVSVTKTASPSPVTAGDLLTYTITVFNAGPSAAQNVELADVVPNALRNPEFSVQGGTTYAPWVSPYQIGTLAAGESFVVTIRGTVDPSAPAGTLTNTASVSSTTPDPDPDNNTGTVETPVVVAADLCVYKVAETNPAIPGQLLEYTIRIANDGPSDAQNVTLIDAVPAALLSPEFSVDGGVTYLPWSNPYTLGTLAAGEGRTILIRGTLSPSATGQIVNTAVVSGTTPDPNPDNNTSTDETPVQPSADISVVKTGTPSPVPVGDRITYTLLVSNAGPAQAVNVVLNDALPAALNDAEYSTDGGVTWAPWTGSLAIGTLESGAARTILLRATVSSSAAGTLTNTATVTSDTPDPHPENNTSTVDTPVQPSADLSVTKTSSPNPVQPGGLLTYTIVVSNAGPADAQAVTLRDIVPASLTDVEVSIDDGATWQPWVSPFDLGVVAADSNRTVLLRGTVSASASGSLVNTVSVASPTPDPDPSNNADTEQTPVSASADISVVKTAQPVPAVPGEPLTFTVTVTNNGPDAAENVLLFDAIPAELTAVQFSTDGGVTWNSWSNPYSIGRLATGQSRTILLYGIVADTACGTISNAAVATSTTPDPDPGNNTGSVDVPVSVGADLSIMKTAYPNPATRCQYVTYTLTVYNAGPAAAQQVLITDDLSPDLSKGIYSTDDGRTWQPWTGSYAVGGLAAGASVSILVAGVISPCAKCSVCNTAAVTSSTPDPDLSNNMACVTVSLCNCRGRDDTTQD